jgi:hypothetical protein
MSEISKKKYYTRICLASAGMVVILRTLTQTDLGYDATVQIQAAHSWLEGSGLKTYTTNNGNITESTAQTLVHFPAGYSFYTAALLSLGIPLFAVPKIFGATFTLIGWCGWGYFIDRSFGSPSARGKKEKYLIRFLAFTLPIFTTPHWNGTDILLWAVVPWIIIFLAEAPSHKNATFIYIAIGFICGIACIFRYASIVLLAFALCITFIQPLPSLKKLLYRQMAIGVSAAIPILVQASIIFSASEPATPGGIHVGTTLDAMIRGLFNGFATLPTWNTVILFWMPERILTHLVNASEDPFYATPLFATCFAIPFFLYREKSELAFHQRVSDQHFIGSVFAAFVPVFLLMCNVFGSYDYVGDRRYYIILIPLAVHIVTYLAFHNRHRGGNDIFVRAICCSLTFAMASANLIGLFFLFASGAHGDVMRSKLMRDSDIRTFLSVGLKYEKSEMRQYVLALLKDTPDAILITNFEHLFWAEKSIDQSRIIRIPTCRQLSGTELRGPQKVIICAIDECDGEFYSVVDVAGKLELVECMKNFGEMRLIKSFKENIFPATKIKLLTLDLPEGTRINF